ncbi:MAG: iron transporter [Burkholderiales bacterium]|nr:iron transporter [Burkholderiales bacterium]
MSTLRQGWLASLSHVVAACGVSYFASTQLVTLTGLLAYAAGMARADAVMLSAMLGFLYLWLILMWAFSRRRAAQTWLLLGVLSVASLLANAAMARALLTGGAA